MADVSSVYISAAVNRFTHAASSSASSLVAFGSSKLIALWDAANPYDFGIRETLPGHEGIVTCVHFVNNELFISADDKGSLRCWRKLKSQWGMTASVQAHDRAISSLTACGSCLVTGASDSTVKVWDIETKENHDELRDVQTLSLQGKYPLAIALAPLPQSQAIILAVGSTDRNVHIWTRSENTFVHSVTLSGHEDWVRNLAFRPLAKSDHLLVLASGSQDGTIRLWNIEIILNDSARSNGDGDQLSDELLDAFEQSLGEIADGEEGGRQISLKRHMMTVKTDQDRSQQFSITFDSLLVGHDAGITCLSWRPSPSESSSHFTSTLLSTSTDSSLILWSPSTLLNASKSEAASIWINRQRFGDVGGQRLGGFVGGLWTKDGGDVTAWGWNGGWRRWRCLNEPDRGGDDDWIEVGAIGGHRGPVRDLDWSPKGEFLISVGTDQTTRIHGPVRTKGTDDAPMFLWHELGRPQVHGYDLIGVQFIDALKFVSIADEKVARVFEAPSGFVDLARGLGVSDLATDNVNRSLAANVPPLGLSNKAVNQADAALVSTYSGEQDLTRPPFEGELSATTLWPEVEKLFGHGYESISLAVSPSKSMIATACKATSPEHAVIRVYNTDTWQLFGQPLAGHSLTVTRIAFSPDDQHILTVSRDRSWRLFRKGTDGFFPVAADKSHGRIIWDCAWSPESDIFATASRDKTVKCWPIKVETGKYTTLATIQLQEAATSVAFSPQKSKRRRLAIGLETGVILLYSSVDPTSWELDLTIAERFRHVDHIYRISWRPTNDQQTCLATCSEDGTLRVLTVHDRVY